MFIAIRKHSLNYQPPKSIKKQNISQTNFLLANLIPLFSCLYILYFQNSHNTLLIIFSSFILIYTASVLYFSGKISLVILTLTSTIILTISIFVIFLTWQILSIRVNRLKRCHILVLIPLAVYINGSGKKNFTPIICSYTTDSAKFFFYSTDLIINTGIFLVVFSSILIVFIFIIKNVIIYKFGK